MYGMRYLFSREVGQNVRSWLFVRDHTSRNLWTAGNETLQDFFSDLK